MFASTHCHFVTALLKFSATPLPPAPFFGLEFCPGSGSLLTSKPSHESNQAPRKSVTPLLHKKVVWQLRAFACIVRRNPNQGLKLFLQGEK